MIRLPDWEDRLAQYLSEVAHAPHVYGSHDCALHGANAVLAQTGEDYAAKFRGRYSTEIGAARALKRYGAGSLAATVDQVLPDRPIGHARRGDLVMVGGMVGVCVGADALFVGEQNGVAGLVRFPRADWARCWGVG